MQSVAESQETPTPNGDNNILNNAAAENIEQDEQDEDYSSFMNDINNNGMNSNFLTNIDMIRNEQQSIKVEQSQILLQNEELLKQLEFLELTFEKKMKSNLEVQDLQEELQQRREALFKMFEVDNLSLHFMKTHNKSKFLDLEEVISYFYFLLSKSIIYSGWHAFHCVDCMAFIVKYQHSIQKQIKNYINLKSQIEDIKNCI